MASDAVCGLFHWILLAQNCRFSLKITFRENNFEQRVRKTLLKTMVFAPQILNQCLTPMHSHLAFHHFRRKQEKHHSFSITGGDIWSEALAPVRLQVFRTPHLHQTTWTSWTLIPGFRRLQTTPMCLAQKMPHPPYPPHITRMLTAQNQGMDLVLNTVM